MIDWFWIGFFVGGWVSTHLINMIKLGSFPQIGMKIKNILKPPPSFCWKIIYIFWGIDPEKRPKTIGSMGLVYINLHEWLICMVFMSGKYTSPMDPMIFFVPLHHQKTKRPKNFQGSPAESETVQLSAALRMGAPFWEAREPTKRRRPCWLELLPRNEAMPRWEKFTQRQQKQGSFLG